MTAKRPSKPKPKPKAKRPRSKPKPRGAKPEQAVADPDKTPDASAPLKNARHERFCQNMAMHGMSQTKAYVLAGYSGTEEAVRANSARLITIDAIATRLSHLLAKAEALAVNVAGLTKADVLNMIAEQHQRNIGVRPVTITKSVGGKPVTMEAYAYNEHAASQTLKLLNDEFGLGEGASGARGESDGDINVRAGLDAPEIVDDLERLQRVRKLVLVGHSTTAPAPAPKDAMAQLKKLAGEK